MNYKPITMNPLKIIFFGSFQNYSVQVLKVLAKHFTVTGVFTTPPKPAGRHMIATPTPIQQYAERHTLDVFALESLQNIPTEIKKPDFLIVAGYGKLIPPAWLHFPKVMAINMHPSLLPDYRGAFPAEWALLRGEKKTGVSLVKMSEEFDKGDILAQIEYTLLPKDTRETIYEKLYDLGAGLLLDYIPKIASGIITLKPQPQGDYFYARRITREDGFVPWGDFTKNVADLEIKYRALTPWPGVWTMTPSGKRLKLVRLHPERMVQLEGKNPVTFKQFASAYLPKE